MKLPQLHLRDLFWLVLVVGMGCAWWLEHRRLVAAEERCSEVETRADTLTERLSEARLNWQSLHDSGNRYNLIERDKNGLDKIRNPYKPR